MTNTMALQMPSSYVLVSEEEMEYVDGGFRMYRANAAIVLDVTAILISAGLAASATIAKFAAKIGLTALKNKLVSAIVKMGISQVWANAALKVIKRVTELSIGTGVAWLLDYTDKSGLNGWIEY